MKELEVSDLNVCVSYVAVKNWMPSVEPEGEDKQYQEPRVQTGGTSLWTDVLVDRRAWAMPLHAKWVALSRGTPGP